MKPFDAERERELNDYVDELTNIKAEIIKKRDAANELIVDLNDDIQAYNNVLKNVDSLATKVTKEFEEHQQDQERSWDETDEGKSHTEMQQKWECIDLSPLDLIDDVEIDDMGHADELTSLPDPR